MYQSTSRPTFRLRFTLTLLLIVLLAVAGFLLVPPPQAQSAAPQEIGEFVAFCPFSHRAPNDPIVHPAMPGMSHSHDFMGNVTTAATSTLESLVAGATTCDPLTDRSAYWVPTLYAADGTILPIDHATLYYSSDIDDPSTLQPFPLGLKIIAGQANAATPPAPSYFKWSCQGEATSSSTDFVVCPNGAKLELLLNFPDCWDGKNLDSTDHKSHMAYNANHACPASHPVALPRLQFKLRYATSGEVGMRLASGAGYTAHGDFFNAWDEAALKNRLECLYRQIKCGAAGFTPVEPTATATTVPATPTPISILKNSIFAPTIWK
jgi:hypothetical protein